MTKFKTPRVFNGIEFWRLKNSKERKALLNRKTPKKIILVGRLAERGGKEAVGGREQNAWTPDRKLAIDASSLSGTSNALTGDEKSRGGGKEALRKENRRRRLESLARGKGGKDNSKGILQS